MKKIEADVVIVGGGMSGIIAAVAAAEKDASVIVFEKGNTVGGAANMGMGFFAIESRLQRDKMYNYTLDEAFMDFMEYNHWIPDAKLIRRLYAQSADTVDWLTDMGVELLGAFKYSKDSNMTWHVVKVPGSNDAHERAASIMVKAVKDRADELGVEFQLGTAVKELLSGDKGKIIGVIAEDSSGEQIEVDCSAVIIATGGFSNNVDMIRDYLGLEWGKDLFTFRIPGIDGEGMRLAWKAGAGKTDVKMEVTYNTPGLTDIYKTLSETMRQPNLMVNLDGERMVNEEIMNNTTYTGNAIMRQKKRCAFTIIADDIVEYYRKQGLDYITVHHNIKQVDNWDKELKSYLSGEKSEESGLSSLHAEENYEQNFWVCNSIEEIAEVTGINPKALAKTIDGYNRMAGSYDEEFGKKSRYMLPVTGKRYYVARHFPSGYGSLGGIKTNHDMNCVSQAGERIPGLFACGTDACNIFSDSYCFNMPGSTMGFAINSGRIAGYEAITYIDSDDFVE